VNKRDILANCAIALITIGGGGVVAGLTLQTGGLSAIVLLGSAIVVACGIISLLALFFTAPKQAEKHREAEPSASVKLDNSTIRIGRLNSTADVAFDAKNNSIASAKHVNHKPKEPDKPQ
jgi:hypothetical protein